MDFSPFDRRGYPALPVRDGYSAWGTPTRTPSSTWWTSAGRSASPGSGASRR